MAVPTFFISANGVDITERLAGGGISMTVTDGIGSKSDTLQIEIDDQDGRVSPPKKGAKLNARGGYRDGLVRDFGTFIVDQVTYSGYPQKISIDAQSVDQKEPAKEHKPKDYRKEEYPTYKDIFSEVAGRAGLSLKISGKLGSIAVEYEAQGEERELEFATRIAGGLDASVMVKNGQMIVLERGSGASVSGGAMPSIIVSKGVNLLSYSVTEMDAPKYSKVKATVYDRKKNLREEVEEATGLEGPTFLIRDPFQTKEEAERGAKTRANQLKRGQATATFEIDGAPGASAGSFVMCSGVRSNVDGRWYAKTVTHSFSSTAPYTTSIECETPT